MRLVYDQIATRHRWHLVVDDGVDVPLRTEGQTLAADLGEIHPAAIANAAGDVVIFTARGQVSSVR